MTDGDWIKSSTARRVIAQWADPRPAWLWSADGKKLVWRNRAARLFGARLKKGEIKLLPNAEPIRGQVPRLMRLATSGHSSLARLQFIAGERPVSATCTVTPLMLADGQAALLVVGVDAVDSEIFRSDRASEPLAAKLLPPESRFVVIDGDGDVVDASPDLAIDDVAALSAPEAKIGEDFFAIERFEAGGDATLLLLTPAEWPTEIPAPPPEPEPDSGPGAEDVAASEMETVAEPGQEAADEAAQEEEPAAPAAQAPAAEPEVEPRGDRRLTALVDRLAEDENLYTPLGERDDFPPQAETQAADPSEAGSGAPEETEAETAGEDGARRMLYRLVGRGFVPLAAAEADEAEIEPEPPEAEKPPPPDMESVERVSRYNFDELSRILNDRVSGELSPQKTPTSIEAIIDAEPAPEKPASAPAPSPAPAPKPPSSGALINLGGETLVLNRLPLGILVFRDQQVLFANRAITEMIGYDSVEQLRAAGLASLFPAASDEMPDAGPINHLVQRDGTLVPVTARLQSVSWQGRPALMLSASTTEVRTGHEGAVRAFAEVLAQAREDGFFDTTRNGIISTASPQAALLLQYGEGQLAGRPLAQIIDAEDQKALQAFLERPARFAEMARPVLAARGAMPGTDVMIFAQGQAGVVTGYFGFVHRREAPPALPGPARQPPGVDNGLLGRLSRGIRRPLNTIIGFSDLIGGKAFGDVGNERYVDYAQDIKTAGHEIAALVDELDDFARLRDGRYAPRLTDIDLVTLLDSCVLRVRSEANRKRVLVRSAVSEHLPRIRADRASLAQAVLNLLASAIDQTPAGGSVVLSAQREDDGSVSVSVRDSAAREAAPAERFVVFRDGLGRDGRRLGPVRSSVGLALTRALLTVNACSLSVDPAGSVGTLFSMVIPAEAVTRGELPKPAEEEDGTD